MPTMQASGPPMSGWFPEAIGGVGAACRHSGV